MFGAALVVLVVAIVSTPAPSRADEDDPDAGGIEWELEAELELTSERVGAERSSEVTFDEVDVQLTGPWWEVQTGIKYVAEAGRGIAVEEASLRLGGTPECPWFVQIGKTVLPFGEFASNFVEDPLVAKVGETDAPSFVVGLEDEARQVSLAGFRTASGQGSVVASARVAPAEAWSLGISWSSALQEAVELRELGEDHREENAVGSWIGAPRPPVEGFAAFVAFEGDVWLGHVEFVTARSSLAEDVIGAGPARPRAFNLEGGWRPRERWRIATRFELADDLPENPVRQYGVAVSHRLNEGVRVVVDFLRGEFHTEEPGRDLVSLQVAFQY